MIYIVRKSEKSGSPEDKRIDKYILWYLPDNLSDFRTFPTSGLPAYCPCASV